MFYSVLPYFLKYGSVFLFGLFYLFYWTLLAFGLQMLIGKNGITGQTDKLARSPAGFLEEFIFRFDNKL